MRIVKFVFIAIQLGQGEMNPTQLNIPVESGCNSEGRLEMANRLLPLVLGIIYLAKKPMRYADLKFLPFLGEELNCTRRSFFRRAKLTVAVKRPSECNQGVSVFPRVTKPFKDFHCFLRL